MLAMNQPPGVRSQSTSDADIVGAIRQLHAQSGYIVDPHTACAVAVALKESASAGSPPVCVACAHPAKFLDTVGTVCVIKSRRAGHVGIPSVSPQLAAPSWTYNDPVCFDGQGVCERHLMRIPIALLGQAAFNAKPRGHQ
jgi:threonine synthase